MKNIRKRICTASLATLIVLGATLPGIHNIKAAEEPISSQEEMNIEELKVEFPNIYAPVKGDSWYISGLKSLGKGILDAGIDKLVNKALDQIFGPQEHGEEILEKLTVINGKLDVIQNMLKYVLEMMQEARARESIEEKLKLYGVVESAANVARKGYEAPMNKYTAPNIDKVKEERWPVLQEWVKLRIESSTDSFSSMHYLCQLITDELGNNYGGNYIKQYEAYGNLVFHWDKEMVDFTDDQLSRDIYYISEMAAFNSLYLTYAKEHNIKMDYSAYRKAMARDIDNLIKTIENTERRKLDDETAKFIKDGKEIIISKNQMDMVTADNLITHIKYDIYYGHLIYAAQDQFRNDVKKVSGYHMMTNEERDIIASYAEKSKRSLKEDFASGGLNQMPGGGTDYLTTSIDRGDRNYFHYGNSYYGRRNMYMENYDMTKNGRNGLMNTLMAIVGVCHKGDEDFDNIYTTERSSWNPCISKVEDNIRDFLYKGATNKNYLVLYVKDTGKGVEEE